MLEVPIDKIVPVTNARARIASLVSDVQKSKSLYVLTRGGKPAAVLASVDYLDRVPEKTKNAVELPAESKNESAKVVEKQKEDHEIEETDENSNSDIVEEKELENNVSSAQDEGQPIKISIQ